jgi:mono/diheme cytochrome c family protein
MNPVLRWTARILGGLLALLVVVLAALYGASEVRIRKTYAVPATPLAIAPSEALAERGHHLVNTRGCADCHGENLGGKLFIDDAAFGHIWSANLTRGEGGAANRYNDAELARAIRHGVGGNGRSLLIMPAQEYRGLSDEDVASLIAYLRALPPVHGAIPASSVGPLGRALYLAGQIPLLPAELVDHEAPPPPAPERGPTAEYGAYLATSCTGCHGANVSGGKQPGTPPGTPPAANLTPDRETGLGAWTEADFVRTLRTGVRPDGRALDAFMPWKMTAQMTDDELHALWLYLQSVPARPFGQR